jgi:hypothetical protein
MDSEGEVHVEPNTDFFIKDLDTGKQFPVDDAETETKKFNYHTLNPKGISVRSVGTTTSHDKGSSFTVRLFVVFLLVIRFLELFACRNTNFNFTMPKGPSTGLWKSAIETFFQ